MSPWTAGGLYEPRSLKAAAPRQRRTRAEVEALDEAIAEAVEADSPVSLRGVFYRVVSAGACPKTDASYTAIMRRLKVLRRTGRVAYGDIVDGTRTSYRTTAYGSAEEALEATARGYRQQLWAEQDDAVILVSEKDAISGVVAPVALGWQVPLIVLRGYSSISANYGIADDINDRLDAGKYVYVYQLGDHDASGVDAWESFQNSVTELLEDEFGFSHDDDGSAVFFERIAVTEEQIYDMGLPTRPGKPKDTRAAEWGNKPNVEVDAIPASVLREIVGEAITQHIDADQLRITREVEKAERELLRGLAA